MSRLSRYARQVARLTAAAVVAAGVPAMATTSAQAATDPTPTVVFYTPMNGHKTAGTFHVLLGAEPAVASVELTYASTAGEVTQTLERRPGSDVFETTSPVLTGTVRLEATGLDASDVAVGQPAVATVTVAAGATRFTAPVTPSDPSARGPFIRPRSEQVGATVRVRPLGVFTRADGRSFARASGVTSAAQPPTADAPTIATVTPAVSALPNPTGTFDPSARIYRQPVDLSGHPGLTSGRAVIRVSDGTSSDAIEAPLYLQTVRAVHSATASFPGGSATTLAATVYDQYGQPIVGAPVRLTGYAAGSPSPVAGPTVVSDGAGAATFTGSYPTGFYVAYADLNLDGARGPAEPGFQWVVGTVSHAAPGKSLFHNNARTRGGSGTIGDSLRGTRIAASRGYQWIDQNGQLSFTNRAVLRDGHARVAHPGQLTWVNAHGAPYNPRWLGKGRYETRAWGMIRRNKGLRNAEMTFQQNAAHGISVEWEVKNIRPFTTPAALNAAFADLAAAAQRYYGAAWQSRVHVKVLSNLPGGQFFALKVLRHAKAHGFTTIYLARGNATRLQIPAAAHGYVDYVRGASGTLYPNTWSNPGKPRSDIEPPFPTS